MEVTGVADDGRPAGRRAVRRELQRVWLACCLAQDTGVVLLDEPTTFLDLRYQVELLDLVRDLADDHRVAVGLVLHDLDQAAAVADELVLLDGGRVRAYGPPAEVLTADAAHRGLRHPHRGRPRPAHRAPCAPARSAGTARARDRPHRPPHEKNPMLPSRTVAAAPAAVPAVLLAACGTTEPPAAAGGRRAAAAAAGPVT